MNAKADMGYYLGSDEHFNSLYSFKMQKLAALHFTPLHITELAVQFLAGKGARILDIGSGAGKFCLAGACYAPDAHFYGVEKRNSLVQHAAKAQKKLRVANASFIHGSFTDLDLHHFDHFYFYNSFYENVDDRDRIDEAIEHSEDLYEHYITYLDSALRQMPAGTRLATYHAYEDKGPDGYEKTGSHENGMLNFWVRK